MLNINLSSQSLASYIKQLEGRKKTRIFVMLFYIFLLIIYAVVRFFFLPVPLASGDALFLSLFMAQMFQVSSQLGTINAQIEFANFLEGSSQTGTNP